MGFFYTLVYLVILIRFLDYLDDIKKYGWGSINLLWLLIKVIGNLYFID